MQLKTKRIPLDQLAPNIGQIPGLPMNPRQWTKADIERIAKSLRETPELFEARPIIAVPFDGKYVILGGNLRYEGARHNGDADAPVCVIPEDMPADKMKEIVVKDNGQFGSWDFDALANEWDDLPLTDWGVPAWKTEGPSPDEFGEDFKLPEGEKSNICTMTFVLATEQRDAIEAAIASIKKSEDYEYMETYGNENTNGNALALLIEKWDAARK